MVETPPGKPAAGKNACPTWAGKQDHKALATQVGYIEE
jgi:hypothetical protein